MKSLADTKLIDILPTNLAEDAGVSAAVSATDDQLATLAANAEQPAIYMRFDALTSAQLDHMAAQYDVSPWRDSWPVALKRSTIKSVYNNLRKRGTVWAVKDAVASLGSAATVVEWWQMVPKGRPHTFNIEVNLSGIVGTLTDDAQEDLIAAIESAKPKRSHYELIIRDAMASTVSVCGFLRQSTYVRLSDI